MVAGRVLRAWREHTGRSGAEVADMMHVVRAAVTNWEQGDRGRRAGSFLPTVRKLAEALDLGEQEARAMVALWQAAGSPAVIDPRDAWSHNFDPSCGPGWLWVRCPAGACRGNAGWGPFSTPFELPAGANGLLIQSPAMVPNPPYVVTLDQPGWVDFGPGLVPEGVARRLGLAYARIDELMNPEALVWAESMLAEGGNQALRAAVHDAAALAARLGMPWVRARARPVPVPRSPVDHPDLVGAASHLLVTPGRAQEIRELRGLSRAEAARQVTALDPGHPVTAWMIEVLEDEGRLPPSPLALSRLDLVLGLDGHLGLDRVLLGTGPRATVSIPAFWRGPVWVKAWGPIELSWHPWRRKHQAGEGEVVTVRKAAGETPPLHVRLPPGRVVAAGLGAVPGAVDLNSGWYPFDIAGAVRIVRERILDIRRGLS